MSKLRKLCAVLCSGTCALGVANANPGKNGNSIMEIAANNPEFFESSVAKFSNEEIAKMERKRKVGSYGPESALWFGSIFGDRATSAMAVGRADILDNRDVLKLMSKADIDSLKTMANKEKIKSILNYIFLRYNFPALPSVVAGFLCMFLVSPFTMDSNTNQAKSKGAAAVNFLVILVACLATYNNVAFVFNKMAHREWGRNKELQDMCKEILEIAERVKRNMQEKKVGKENSNVSVKEKKKLKFGKASHDINKKKITKIKTKRKVAKNVDVVGKDSSKTTRLSKSVDATSVAQ